MSRFKAFISSVIENVDLTVHKGFPSNVPGAAMMSAYINGVKPFVQPFYPSYPAIAGSFGSAAPLLQVGAMELEYLRMFGAIGMESTRWDP